MTSWTANRCTSQNNQELNKSTGETLQWSVWCLPWGKCSLWCFWSFGVLVHVVACCCCCCVTSVVSDSVRPHRWQPTRLPHPWDSPGQNTGVGCHFLLQCIKVKRESDVAQSCPTLRDPMDCSLPGSSIHGIFQARVLEWGAIAFYVVAWHDVILSKRCVKTVVIMTIFYPHPLWEKILKI